MAISREKKEELVALYVDLLERSQGLVITDYRGMNMNQLTVLREKLSESEGQFMVTKNTLFKLALQACDMVVPEELLNGPVAVGFALEDIAGTVKAILDAGDDDDLAIEVKGGILGENVLDYDQLKQLTKLPTLPEVRAQLLGLFTSPATNIVSLLEQPARDVVTVIDAASTSVLNVIAAYAAKQESEEAA